MNASGCPFVQTVIMRLTPGATSFLFGVGLGVGLDGRGSPDSYMVAMSGPRHGSFEVGIASREIPRSYRLERTSHFNSSH
jgi:hypothetical protein